MNSQEEAGYALFYPLLNETQFRELMQRDGVDFIPDRVVRDEEGGIAYFSSCAGDIVYLAPDLTSVRLLSKQDRSGCVRDARWRMSLSCCTSPPQAGKSSGSRWMKTVNRCASFRPCRS